MVHTTPRPKLAIITLNTLFTAFFFKKKRTRNTATTPVIAYIYDFEKILLKIATTMPPHTPT